MIIKSRTRLTYRHFLAGFFITVSLVFGLSLSPVLAESCPEGLVGYWKLDDTDSLNKKFSDAVNAPNGNNGICDTDCPSYLDPGAVSAAQSF